MNASYLRPLPKPETEQATEPKLPRFDWQMVALIVGAVVIFYFTAIGFWTVVAPLIRHH